MLSVFTYQVLRLLREKVLLVWTLGFPIILSLIFMAMFSNLDATTRPMPSPSASCRTTPTGAAPRPG